MGILCRKNEKAEKKMLKNAQIETERLPPGHENRETIWLFGYILNGKRAVGQERDQNVKYNHKKKKNDGKLKRKS